MFKKGNRYILLCSALLLMLLAGCTGMRSVSEGNHLFTGHVLNIDSARFISNLSETRSELNGLVLTKPNTKLLWMRPLLCLHNLVPEPKKESGFWYWLKYTLGEKPAILETIDLQSINTSIENRLQNRGNFDAKSSYEVVRRGRKAKVRFAISPGRPYTLKSIKFPSTREGIDGDINKLQPNSILKQGNTYNLRDFVNERIRIGNALMEKGYFYFRPENLIFTADTSVGNRNMNIWLNLKPDVPAEAITAFRFKKIFVFDDFSTHNYNPDTTRIGNYYYISEMHRFNPNTILESVFFEKDSLYSRTNHFYTLQRLMALGVFKTATASFITNDSLPAQMNVKVFLTPTRRLSVGAEMNATIKSNNYMGPGLNLNYRNRNLFGGAELLTVTLGGFFDVQYSGSSKGQASYQINLDAAITIPKFAFFNVTKNTIKSLAPRTIFNVGGGTYTRIGLYELHSFNIAMEYRWRTSEFISHQLTPVDVSYTNLAKSSAEFDDFLQQNPIVQESFEQQFIIGSNYNFVNSNIFRQHNSHRFFFNATVDLAGNFTSLITTIFKGSRPSATDQHKLLGMAYSQYAMIRNDVRYFYTPNAKNQIATRLIAGVGVPYGNSATIPFIKQYYVGGANNIRAFIAKTIGPGTFSPPDSISTLNVAQSGDITLGTSVEYRFGIYRFFKGALFVDAGNVWLVKEDPQRPGSQFNFNTFYNEMAVGAGYGFRFDFDFILLRLDLAFPLRKPNLPEGQQWVVDQINLGSKSWRRDNVLWNIAIGYPF